MNVMISSPLERTLAERIRKLPNVDELLYDEMLLPQPRFPNDHAGMPIARTAEMTDRWHAMLARAEVLFGYPDESSAGLVDVLRRAPNVRFVQGTSAGMGAHVRRANLESIILERVQFATAAGVHAAMLAEFVFYGLLMLRKDTQRLIALRAQRRWEHFVMGELDGSRLAIVGMGQIGGAIAVRARAFGMHVIAVNRRGNADARADETFATADLAKVAATCDALVVTLPATDLTVGLVDAAAIAALPSHAIMINVGRGTVVDNDALIAALHDNRIAGAALDVFAIEPLSTESPLWDMPNVVLTPHTAALSIHENRRIVEIFCENLGRFSNGRPLRNAVNLSDFY